MSNYIVNSDYLTSIADAIREKTGSTDTFTIDQMPTAINSITTSGSDGSLDFNNLTMAKIVATNAIGSLNVGNYVSSVNQIKFAVWQGNVSKTSGSNIRTLIYIPSLFNNNLIVIGATGTTALYTGYVIGDLVSVSGRSGSVPSPGEVILVATDATTLKIYSSSGAALSYFLAEYGTFTFWYEEV